MNLFRLPGLARPDPFQISTGSARVVVGAPHHGTRPEVDADLGSGPVALALADRLAGRVVVVSNLRRTVDVNKDPRGLDPGVRGHAVRYQNELFQGLPGLVIEIHGHVSGQYTIEVTTGFDLDPSVAADAAYLEKLRLFKGALPGAVAAKTGMTPTVGIFPLDADVRKAATGTFTFQKIRRARNLAGLEWFGLHIELHAALRTSKAAKAPAYIDALGTALAQAVRQSFGEVDRATALIPARSDQGAGVCETAGEGVDLTVAQVPEKYILQPVVLLNAADLEALGVLEGDRLVLCNGGESVAARAAALQTVRAGQAGVPERLRRQVGLEVRQKVRVARASAAVSEGPARAAPYLALGEIRAGGAAWMAPADLERLGLTPGSMARFNGVPASVQSDPALPGRVLALGSETAGRLGCTIGEVLAVEPFKGGGL